MPLKLFCISLGILFLLIAGFQPDGIAFIPNAGYSDIEISHWPAAAFLRESILVHGEYPLWRDSIMGGHPFAANPLNKTAYPLQWFALIFPPALHLNLQFLLHLLIAGVGMWRWSRLQGLRPEAAAVSALGYALAPRLLAHTGAGHLDLFYALAWWPWLMAEIPGAIQDKIRPIVLLRLALFAGLIFLADIRLSLFALSTASAYGLVELARTSQNVPAFFARLPRFLPVALLFLLITASVTVPLLAWRPYMTRAELTIEGAGILSLEPFPVIMMLFLHTSGGNIELLGYLGLALLILALIAAFSQPRRFGFWIVLALFAGFYALGVNGFLWPTLVRLVPGLLWFRVPSRAWFVLTLVIAMLAGHGVETLLAYTQQQLKGHNRAKIAAVVLLALSVIGGGFMIAASPLMRAAGLQLLVVGGGMAAILLLALSGKLESRRLALALIGLVFIDLAWTGTRWLEWRGEDYWLTPYHPVAQALIDDQADRVYSPAYNLPQQVVEHYSLKLFGGIDPFQLRGMVDAIHTGGGISSDHYDVVVPAMQGVTDGDVSQANRSAVPDTQVLAAWNVSHVIAAYPIENDRLSLIDQFESLYLYRNRDYTPQPMTSYGWPENWPGLPDISTVTQLNNLTLAAAGIGGITLLICVGAVIFLTLRQRQ